MSRQGRKISDIDEDLNISLVQDEGLTWFQDADAKILEKASDDIELVLQENEPTKLVKDQGSGEKGEKEVTTPANYHTYIKRRRGVSTGSDNVSTASEISSTAGIIAKDKGKAIMTESEPEKKTKLKERQERARLEATIRLQEQLDDEERQRLAMDAEIAQRLQEEINVVVAQESSAQARQSEEREQGGYKMKDFKGMSYDDIRPIFEKTFVDMLKNFDREDLLKLWSLVQERFNSSGLANDKEKELWVELKMLFEPDEETLSELQRYMHDLLK
ncbi:hypothetical protein Tco_1143804 [Tanacetum coccineum]